MFSLNLCSQESLPRVSMSLHLSWGWHWHESQDCSHLATFSDKKICSQYGRLTGPLAGSLTSSLAVGRRPHFSLCGPLRLFKSPHGKTSGFQASIRENQERQRDRETGTYHCQQDTTQNSGFNNWTLSFWSQNSTLFHIGPLHTSLDILTHGWWLAT